MKKIISLLLLLVSFSFINVFSYASSSPTYDETYDNNEGAFYSNRYSYYYL